MVGTRSRAIRRGTSRSSFSGFSHGRSRAYSGYGICSRLWTCHAGSRGSASLPWKSTQPSGPRPVGCFSFRRPRDSLDPYESRYGRFARASKNSQLTCGDIIIICETVHWPANLTPPYADAGVKEFRSCSIGQDRILSSTTYNVVLTCYDNSSISTTWQKQQRHSRTWLYGKRPIVSYWRLIR